MMDTYKIVYAIKKKDQPVEVLDKFIMADTPQMAISEFNKAMKEEPCYTIISVYFLLDTLPAKEKVENDDVLCHTNLKENAELIAKILDADARGEVFISTRAKHVNYHGYTRKSQQRPSFEDGDSLWDFSNENEKIRAKEE